jgi:hypothetical protein
MAPAARARIARAFPLVIFLSIPRRARSPLKFSARDFFKIVLMHEIYDKRPI